MRRRHQLGDEQIVALWEWARSMKDSYDDMNFTPASLARITASTLIVYGDRDPLLSGGGWRLTCTARFPAPRFGLCPMAVTGQSSSTPQLSSCRLHWRSLGRRTERQSRRTDGRARRHLASRENVEIKRSQHKYKTSSTTPTG